MRIFNPGWAGRTRSAGLANLCTTWIRGTFMHISVENSDLESNRRDIGRRGGRPVSGVLRQALAAVAAAAVPLGVAWVGVPSTGEAADYCWRHIYNKTPRTYTLAMCNRNRDCKMYTVGPKAAVKFGIPDDRQLAFLCEGKSAKRRIVNLGGGSKTLRIDCEKFYPPVNFDFHPPKFSPGDYCHISRVNGNDLGSYGQKTWLTVNEPANGDILIYR